MLLMSVASSTHAGVLGKKLDVVDMFESPFKRFQLRFTAKSGEHVSFELVFWKRRVG